MESLHLHRRYHAAVLGHCSFLSEFTIRVRVLISISLGRDIECLAKYKGYPPPAHNEWFLIELLGNVKELVNDYEKTLPALPAPRRRGPSTKNSTSLAPARPGVLQGHSLASLFAFTHKFWSSEYLIFTDSPFSLLAYRPISRPRFLYFLKLLPLSTISPVMPPEILFAAQSPGSSWRFLSYERESGFLLKFEFHYRVLISQTKTVPLSFLVVEFHAKAVLFH